MVGLAGNGLRSPSGQSNQVRQTVSKLSKQAAGRCKIAPQNGPAKRTWQCWCHPGANVLLLRWGGCRFAMRVLLSITLLSYRLATAPVQHQSSMGAEDMYSHLPSKSHAHCHSAGQFIFLQQDMCRLHTEAMHSHTLPPPPPPPGRRRACKYDTHVEQKP